MILSTQNVHKGQHENDPSRVSGCLQLRVGAVASWKQAWGAGVDKNGLEPECLNMQYSYKNQLFYTFNCWGLQCVNYIPIQLGFFSLKKKADSDFHVW